MQTLHQVCTLGNVGDVRKTVNGNAMNQRKIHKNYEENAKFVEIIGDSMIKLTNGWEIAKTKKKNKKISPSCFIFVRTFPGAKTHCMDHYITSPNGFN